MLSRPGRQIRTGASHQGPGPATPVSTVPAWRAAHPGGIGMRRAGTGGCSRTAAARAARLGVLHHSASLPASPAVSSSTCRCVRVTCSRSARQSPQPGWQPPGLPCRCLARAWAAWSRSAVQVPGERLGGVVTFSLGDAENRRFVSHRRRLRPWPRSSRRGDAHPSTRRPSASWPACPAPSGPRCN